MKLSRKITLIVFVAVILSASAVAAAQTPESLSILENAWGTAHHYLYKVTILPALILFAKGLDSLLT